MQKTHGLSYKHPLWSTWKSMRTRCNNPNAKSYKHYGARGIKVCDRWDSFELFIDDVGAKPNPTYQLDRIDNNKGYEPRNVRWATRSEQNANQRPSGKSGIKGVYFYPKLNKWVARSCKSCGKLHLGVFKTPKEAEIAIENFGCVH